MSTETKWTPGNWYLGQARPIVARVGDFAVRTDSDIPPSIQTAKHDANLIAQAPRMYEALDEALEVLIDVAKTSGLTHSDAESVADNIWDVMAAARGES